MTVKVPVLTHIWKSCRVRSCYRHESCQYIPCRNEIHDKHTPGLSYAKKDSIMPKNEYVDLAPNGLQVGMFIRDNDPRMPSRILEVMSISEKGRVTGKARMGLDETCINIKYIFLTNQPRKSAWSVVSPDDDYFRK